MCSVVDKESFHLPPQSPSQDTNPEPQNQRLQNLISASLQSLAVQNPPLNPCNSVLSVVQLRSPSAFPISPNATHGITVRPAAYEFHGFPFEMRLLLSILTNLILWGITILLFVLTIGTVDFFFGVQTMSLPKLVSLSALCGALCYSLKWVNK